MDTYQSLKKNIYLWILTFALLLQAVLIVCRLLGTASYGDWDSFQYVGWACSHGQSMYVDCWDNKGPLVFFFNAVGMLGGEWGCVLFFGAANCIYTLFLYGALSRRYGRWKAAAAALFGSVALTYIDGGNTGNNAETAAVVLTGIGLFLFYRFDLEGRRTTAFWQGAVTAALFFTKATLVGFGFFYVFSLFFVQGSNSVGKIAGSLLRFILGGLFFLLIIAVSFGSPENLEAMYDASIYYNAFEYHSGSCYARNLIINLYETWPTLTIPAFLLLISVVRGIFRGRQRGLTVSLLLWFLFEMAVTAKVDTFFLHYLAIASVAVIPLFLECAYQSYIPDFWVRKLVIVVSIVVLYWLSFIARVQIHNLISTKSLRYPAQYACEKGLKGKRVAIFGMAGVCRVARLAEMNVSNIYVGGVGHYVQTDSVSRRSKIAQSAINALNSRSTVCLISEGQLELLPWASLPEWKRASDKWELMGAVEGIWFYRRKGETPDFGPS